MQKIKYLGVANTILILHVLALSVTVVFSETLSGNSFARQPSPNVVSAPSPRTSYGNGGDDGKISRELSYPDPKPRHYKAKEPHHYKRKPTAKPTAKPTPKPSPGCSIPTDFTCSSSAALSGPSSRWLVESLEECCFLCQECPEELMFDDINECFNECRDCGFVGVCPMESEPPSESPSTSPSISEMPTVFMSCKRDSDCIGINVGKGACPVCDDNVCTRGCPNEGMGGQPSEACCQFTSAGKASCNANCGTGNVICLQNPTLDWENATSSEAVCGTGGGATVCNEDCPDGNCTAPVSPMMGDTIFANYTALDACIAAVNGTAT